MQNTSNPALALQAYVTTIFQQVYYGDVPEFGVYAPSESQSFVSVLVPRGFLGLIGVTVVLGVHLLLVLGAIMLFRKQTRYSMIKNSWQSVTQTFSPDTQRLFATTSLLSDTEIEKLLESHGQDKTRVVVKQLYNSQRVGVEAVQ